MTLPVMDISCGMAEIRRHNRLGGGIINYNSGDAWNIQRVADKEGSKYRNLQSDCLNPFRFEPNSLDDEQQRSGVDF